MKNLPHLLIALSVLLLGSCNLVMKTFFHISNPEPVTEQKVLKYGKRKNFDTSRDFFFVDSTAVVEAWSEMSPKIYIYDSTGAVLHFLSCFRSNLEDMKYYFRIPVEDRKAVDPVELHTYGSGPSRDTVFNRAPVFSNIKNQIHNAKGEHVELPKSHYYVVCYWSTSFGRINKTSHAAMGKYLREHPDLNATFIPINCDFMTNWSFTEKEVELMKVTG